MKTRRGCAEVFGIGVCQQLVSKINADPAANVDSHDVNVAATHARLQCTTTRELSRKNEAAEATKNACKQKGGSSPGAASCT